MRREPLPVRIEASVLREIARHAASAYPEEGSGALLGSDPGRVQRMLPLQSRGARVPARLGQETDELGLKRVGSWHSHPEGLALPREVDRRIGRDGALILIVSVDGVTGPGEITAWRVEASDRHFQGIPIEDGDSLVSTLDAGRTPAPGTLRRGFSYVSPERENDEKSDGDPLALRNRDDVVSERELRSGGRRRKCQQGGRDSEAP